MHIFFILTEQVGIGGRYDFHMCLFLEDWANMREEFYSYSQSMESYDKWKDQTLAYYSSLAVETKEPKDMNENERITKRNEYLKALYENPDNTL